MFHSLRLTLMCLSLTTGMVAQTPAGSARTDSSTMEVQPAVTVEALPVDMKALARLKGPQTFHHDGRTFRLDLTGWERIFICDGPHTGPEGAHVLGTYAKALPGVEREVHLTIRLLPRSARDGVPFDPLPQTPERATERRLIAMGGQPGTLHLTSLERRPPTDPRPRTWYVSAEQAGSGWLLWLEAEGTVRDPGALAQEMTRLGSSLRRMVGMPPSP